MVRRGAGDVGAVKSSARAVIALAAGGILGLAGCGTTQEAATPSGANTPASSAANTPAGLPEAADGADVEACADGECEVRVGASARIPIPPSSEVGSLVVQSIADEKVTFTGRVLGNRQSGGCTGKSCSGSGSHGQFTLILGPDSTGRENNLTITLVAVDATSAVVQLGLL